MDRRGWELFAGDERCPRCGGGEETGCSKHTGGEPGGEAWRGRVWCMVKDVPTPKLRVIREADYPGEAAPEGEGAIFEPIVSSMAPGSGGRMKRVKGGGDGAAFRRAARKEAVYIWEQAAARLGHAHVAAYIAGRGLDVKELAGDIAMLGYMPEHEIVVPVMRGATKEYFKARGPVLVAACIDLAGEVIGVQRIMLDREGKGTKRPRPDGWPEDEKWDVKRAKGSANSGGAVRLGWPERGADTVVLCEGLETGLAIRQATGLPVFVCVSIPGLKNVELPACVKHVVIAADNDTKKPGKVGPGEKAAVEKAREILDRLPGSTVRVVMPTPDVARSLFDEYGVPRVKGCDWLDVLLAVGEDALVRAIDGDHAVVAIDRVDKAVERIDDAVVDRGGDDPENIVGLLGGVGRTLEDPSEVALARYTLLDVFKPMLGDRSTADERWPLVRRGTTWYVWVDGKGKKPTYWREIDEEALYSLVGRNLQKYRTSKAKTIEPLNPGAKTIANTCRNLIIDAAVRRDVVPGWLCGTFNPDGRPNWDSTSAILEDEGFGRPDPTQVLAVPEGLLDITRWLSGEVVLHQHTSRWFSPVCSPVAVPWDRVRKALEHAGSNAEKQMDNMELLAAHLAPKWHSTLKQNLPGEDDRRLLQEYAGLCGTADMKFEQALVLIGGSGTGKSTAIDIMPVLYGEEGVYKLAITDLEDKYKLARLVGKNAAVMPDEAMGSSDRAVIMSKLAKWLGRDALNSDRKFKTDVEFKPTAKLIIGFNEMPKFPDAAGKLARRFMPLEFRRIVPDEEKDRTLKDRWVTEAPGILLWALVGLRRLKKRGHFKLSAASSDRLAEFKEQNAPVQMFIAECVDTLDDLRVDGKISTAVEAGEVMVMTELLFSAYTKWCERNHVFVNDIGGFQERVRSAVPCATIIRPRKGGAARKRFWSGLRLNGDGLKLLTDGQRRDSGETPTLAVLA